MKMRLDLIWLGSPRWVPQGPEETWAAFPARGALVRVFGCLDLGTKRWRAEALELPCCGTGRTFEAAKRQLERSLSDLHSDELAWERRFCRKAQTVLRYYAQLLDPVPWERADTMVFPALSERGELMYSPVRHMLSETLGPIRLYREPEKERRELELMMRSLGVDDGLLKRIAEEVLGRKANEEEERDDP